MIDALVEYLLFARGALDLTPDPNPLLSGWRVALQHQLNFVEDEFVPVLRAPTSAEHHS